MTSTRRTAINALVWEIWTQVIPIVWLVLGQLTGAWVARQFSATGGGEGWNIAATLLALCAFMQAFFMITLTESNQRRDRKGFPQRLFTLPVSTLALFTIPLVMSVAVVELVYLSLWIFNILEARSPMPLWVAFKILSFLLTYHMMMWCAVGIGVMRMVVVGLSSFFFIVLDPTPLMKVLLTLWTVAAFLICWWGVASQRSGAGRRRGTTGTISERLVDWLPSRSTPFASAQSAQFWYEWRKVGYLLPLFVCTLLLLVIAPLSVLMADNGGRTSVLLFWTLLLPVMLAVPLGKAFSKADTWSADMTLDALKNSVAMPAFLVVRPLSDDDIILAKMRAAMLSTAVSWLAVTVFVLLWWCGWADTSGLRNFAQVLWAIQYHSLTPQLAIAILMPVLCILLTWRFLVSGLWIGLSGNGALFTFTTLPIVLIPTVGLLLVGDFFSWLLNERERLTVFVWCMAVLVMAKFWLATYTWRDIGAGFTRGYLLLWFAGTACMLTLALLLAEAFSIYIGIDFYHARTLLICIALLIMPLMQLGMAPRAFAGNRHR